MPLSCRNKRLLGREACLNECPAVGPGGIFQYVRVESPDDIPPAADLTVDVAMLDMNHGWPNLGHDSLVFAVQDAACDLMSAVEGTGLRVRALSYDVRRKGMIPEGPGGRFSLYIGTGGPGDLDPHRNHAGIEGSQGIEEDPSWEAPCFALFDRIEADTDASLLAVCHSFGVMCRWKGVAHPVLRGPEKGGKSTGVLENVLTPEAQAHPWFGRFAELLPEGRRLRVVDNRLFDLIPDEKAFGRDIVTIAHETRGIGGPKGDAITMLEFARDAAGTMPRVFGVNHHPEIVDRSRQLMILRQKFERGEVTPEWYEERREILTRTYPAENSDRRLHVTSDFTLLGPLRFHLNRQVRLRAEALGLAVTVHEDQVVEETIREGTLAPLEPVEGSGVL